MADTMTLAPMRAVIFDIDGTLLRSADDDDALYRASVQHVLGPVHLRPSLGDYDFVTDAGILSQILQDNGIRPDPVITSEIKKRFVTALTAHIEEHGPFDEIRGAKDFLVTLAASRTYAVAIATGGWRETAQLKLQSAGFDTSRIPLATSDDSFDRAEIMKQALSRLGAGFESIMYFGDGPWDRDACAALGWQFVAVGAALGGIESYRELNSELP